MLVRELSNGHEIIGTVRESLGKNLPLSSFIDSSRIRFGISAENNYGLTSLLEIEQPNVVLNCIGVVKQLQESKDISTSEIANSKFPHFLSQSCALVGARLIHFSTDCVFSGRTGSYKESDVPDPTDNYGETKIRGELRNERDLTLRTSFVGRELVHFSNLFEWARRQRGTQVRGFRRAIYSGVTTMTLARIVRSLIHDRKSLAGLFHVASQPISKYDLLCSLSDQLDLDLTVIPDDSFVCDRSLDGSRFVNATGITVPDWQEMLADFAADESTYEQLGFQ